MPNASLLIPLELQPSLSTRRFYGSHKRDRRVSDEDGEILWKCACVCKQEGEREGEARRLLMHLNESSVLYRNSLRDHHLSRNLRTHTHTFPIPLV